MMRRRSRLRIDDSISGRRRIFFQSRERRPEESIPPAQLRTVNFPVEDGQLLTQREILRQERCSGHDQALDEPKKS